MLDSWLVKRLLAGMLMERFFVCPYPTSGHLVYNLSRQVLVTTWIGRAWKECASLGSGRVVDSGQLGNVKFEEKYGENTPRLDGKSGWLR
ncbi:hypothetical protein ACFX1W_044294 [Malus domestica]